MMGTLIRLKIQSKYTMRLHGPVKGDGDKAPADLDEQPAQRQARSVWLAGIPRLSIGGVGLYKRFSSRVQDS